MQKFLSEGATGPTVGPKYKIYLVAQVDTVNTMYTKFLPRRQTLTNHPLAAMLVQI